MPRMTDTVEELIEGTSSIEETENYDITENFICALPGVVVDNKSDEEMKMCTNEFSNLLIDYSEEQYTPKDISKVKSKTSNVLNPLSEINHQDTGLKFFNKDYCADSNLLSCEESECFEIRDPNMIKTKIESMEFYNFLGETELKSRSDELEQGFINYEKSAQNVNESAEKVVELNIQCTKHRNVVPSKQTIEITNPNLESPCYLNRPSITDDVNKLSHLNIPVCEESDETVKVVAGVIKGKVCLQKISDTTTCTSGYCNNVIEHPRAIVQPSQKAEVGGNSQVSENISNQIIETVEQFCSKQNASEELSRVLEESFNQSAESLDKESQTPAIGNSSSAVSVISNYETNTSKTVIEQSEVSAISEEPSEIVISRKIGCRLNLKKVQLTEVLKYLDNIISLVDNIESIDKYSTKTVASLITRQQEIQELINIVNEYLVKLQFLPSSVIVVDNEYTVGKMNFNVKLFGESIFEKLKSMKRELNGAFREFNAFRKDFRYISRKICSVPFELTQDHEMQRTLDKTTGIHLKVLHVLDNKRTRLEIIEEKIFSETLIMVSHVKDFENYLHLLIESQCSERLV